MRSYTTARSRVVIGWSAVMLTAAATAHAATLTGVVKKPAAPYDPAPFSTVTVFDADGTQKIAGPDSFDNGNYTFTVPRGKKVLVRASWRPTESLPGTTVTTISNETTRADVLLQPKKDSDEARFFGAGAMTAKAGAATTRASVNTLYAQEVPAASLYNFILGAKSESAEAAKPFTGLEIFKSNQPAAITEGLQAVQLEWQVSQTVPAYSVLNRKFDGKVSQGQYAEILAFAAPPDAATNVWWQAALKKTASDGNLAEFEKNYSGTRILVYDPKALHYN
jgi:hypothetical protein